MQSAEFATTIESDAPIVVDRTMRWPPGANAYGSHADRAVVAPGTTWYLAEGATHSGFDLFYLIENPGDRRRRRERGVPASTAARADPGHVPRRPQEPLHTVGRHAFRPWRHRRVGGLALERPHHRRARHVPDWRGQGVRSGARECRDCGAGEPLVLRGGRDRRLLRHVHPAREPGRPRRERVGDVSCCPTAAPSPGRTSSRPGHGSRSGSIRRTHACGTRRSRRWSHRPTACPSSPSGRCGGQVRPRPRGARLTRLRGRRRPSRAGAWPRGRRGRASTRTSSWRTRPASRAGYATTLFFEDGQRPVSGTFDLAPTSRFNVYPPVDFPGTFSGVTRRRFGARIESMPEPGQEAGGIVVERAMYSGDGVRAWAAGTNALATPCR